MAACSIAGCPSSTHAKGYCRRHYNRAHRQGNPIAPTQSDRLWSRIDRKSPDECWPWTGFRNRDGYGHILIDGRPNQRAHRVVYREVYGELDDGAVVRHTCDNPPCCNPAHLLAGSQAENMSDVADRRRWPRRWTDDQLEAVRIDTRPGKVVAAEYGMSMSYVYLLRKQYRHGMHRTFIV